MDLTREEEQLLNGAEGNTVFSAYRILTAVGRATVLPRSCPYNGLIFSGVNYNTIGETGRKFLEEFCLDAKVRVKTTINPMGFDERSRQESRTNLSVSR